MPACRELSIITQSQQYIMYLIGSASHERKVWRVPGQLNSTWGGAFFGGVVFDPVNGLNVGPCQAHRRVKLPAMPRMPQ